MPPNTASNHSSTGIYFAIIESANKKEILGLLTRIFTSSRVIHCGFVDTNASELIDMYKGLRVTAWPRYSPIRYRVRLYPAERITRGNLDFLIANNCDPEYGYLDYLMFGFRWILKPLGIRAPDFDGRICSELVAEWSNKFGYNFPTKIVAAPVDIERHIVNVLELPVAQL